MGLIYNSLGEFSKALEFYNKALPLSRQVGDKAGKAATLTNIGLVYSSLGEKAMALEFYNRVLPLSRQIGDKRGEAKTLHSLMLLYNNPQFSQRSQGMAALYGKQSVNLYQTLRVQTQNIDRQSQQTFTKDVERTYQYLTSILANQQRFAEAQQIYLLLTLQNAREAGATSQSLIPDTTPLEKALSQRYDQAVEAISKIATALIPLQQLRAPTPPQRAQREGLEKQLAQAQEAFLAFLSTLPNEFKNAPPQIVEKPKLATEFQASLQTLQQQTKTNTTTILTIVFKEGIEFLVVRDGKTTQREQLIKRDELHKKIEDFKVALTTLSPEGKPQFDPIPIAKQLHNILIQPIAADIADCSQVIWALDGRLRYIPLTALHDGQNYLVEKPTRHTLFTAESISTLAATPSTNKRLLALGTSKEHTTEGYRFEALPGVTNEIAAIKASKALTDTQFTKPAFLDSLKDRYPFVHLATHFALRPGNLYNSFVLLGDGKALRLSEVNALPDDLFAGVELLTLSACETGSGMASSNGAELESFGYLAQRKGAAAVLSTLWPVNDTSTATLMGRFYSTLGKSEGVGKAECLRQAQVALLTGLDKPAVGRRGLTPATISKGFSAPAFVWDAKTPCAHPYYWAPFTLLGNPR